MGFHRLWFKICFRSTYVFYVAFNFIYLKGNSFYLFGAKSRLFAGWGQVQIVLGSTHIVQQLLFFLLPPILTFDYDSIWGSFLTFWGLNGLFLGPMLGQKTLLVSIHVVEQR